MRARLPIRLLTGAAITGLLIALALLSLAWTPENPARMHFALKLKPPLAAGLLGTDAFGRDVASMLMVGARNSLMVAALAVAVGGGLGTLAGFVVAARRGWVEAVVMRGCDVLFAVPPILSAMMLGTLIGTGAITAIVAIAVFMVPVFARVSLGAARQVWARDYVLAARGAGKGPWLITLHHILPNSAPQLIVQASAQLGLAMLTEAGLSFIGLDLPPPAPTWGGMLANAETYMAAAPWLAIAPGLAITLAVFGFTLLGDGLRDWLDPREGGRT